MLSDAQKRFVELEKRKAEVKKYYDELNEAMKAVAEEVGIGGMFQDPSDGTVYKIVKPDGRFVPFEDVSYQRTRRGYLGEVKADLSMKAAEEAGFTLGENQTVVVKTE